MEACYAGGRINVAGHIYNLEIGQLVAGSMYLANRWNWTRAKIRWFLNRLRDEGMIIYSQPNNQGQRVSKKDATNIATLCNYPIYQGSGGNPSAYAIDTQQPTKQPANNQLTTS